MKPQKKPETRLIHRPDFSVLAFHKQYAEQIKNLSKLSPRELQVLGYMGLGFSTRELTTLPGCQVSTKTIESYKEHIKEKLNLVNHGEMLRFAIQYYMFLEINGLEARVITTTEFVSRRAAA
jgi:DNA-binding CsgD family transcriptional regulator